MLYGFNLGREFRLSIAELLSVFQDTQVVYSATGVLILDGLEKSEVLEKASRLGGTIKIFELTLLSDEENITDNIISLSQKVDGKFKYSLNLFGEKSLSLEDLLKKSKRALKTKSISARYFNKDDGKNLSSAQILGNSILKKGFDLNIVDVGGIYYFGKTIWVQDIEAYSNRDYSKNRDMQIGMLPPKLCQIMINLSGANIIYDPFVGLGTVLIESLFMGNKEVYGSDLNDSMVEASKDNIKTFINKLSLSNNILFQIDKLNSKFIDESEILKTKKVDAIVTEGYLGEVMTQKNISLDRIEKQKTSLLSLYEKFFAGLQKIGFSGTVVISFPFWNLKGKHVYFTELYDILHKYTDIIALFPSEFNFSQTKSGSLLYKREKQLVGREIFKLKIK